MNTRKMLWVVISSLFFLNASANNNTRRSWDRLQSHHHTNADDRGEKLTLLFSIKKYIYMYEENVVSAKLSENNTPQTLKTL